MEVSRRLDDSELALVDSVLATASPTEASRLADDAGWRDIAQHGRRRFAAVVDPELYAQLTHAGRSWALELVRRAGADAHRAEEALRALLDVAGAEGGGAVQWWAHQPTAEHEALATAVGMAPTRTLWQLRRPLPVDEAPSIAVRAFEPGRDEAAWLAVNNRAFAAHADQSDWTDETLGDRMAEDWFDPAGFLLHEDDDGRLLGFCWTKVHADVDPALGEIYVIGVDPDAGGRGLGRQLVLAGLRHLHDDRGVRHGMLYTDGDNDAALRLYEGLGFTRHHADVAYSTST